MKNYDVKIIKTLETVISVPAESEKEAIFKVKDLVDISKISKIFVMGLTKESIKVESSKGNFINKIKKTFNKK